MSIAELQRVSLIGLRSEKERVLEDLQALGTLHLIPLSESGDPLPLQDGPSREAREALQFLLSCRRPRRAVTESSHFDPLEVERRALEVKRHTMLLGQERDFLAKRIRDLEPWGDFEFPPIEHLDGNRIWFYRVPHRSMPEVAASGLSWESVREGYRHHYVCVLSPGEPDHDAMPVPRTRTGARSRRELRTRLEEVETELEDAIAEREALSRWRLLLARSLDRLEEVAARVEASRGTFDEEDLFALQAWLPRDRRENLEEWASRERIALEVTAPDPGEQPPTLLMNPPALRAGEDLVSFYQTPGYWVWDPSSIVFVSFVVFFGMIVADCGYGLVLLGIVVLLWSRLGASEAGRRWRTLLGWLAVATMAYGVLVGSYFGLTPSPQSFFGALHLLDFGDSGSMMTLSIIVGAVHVVLANLKDAQRLGRSPLRWASIGWAAIVGGGTIAWAGTFTESEPLAWAGAAVAGAGLLTAMAFAGHGKKPFGRIAAALGVIPGLSGAFGDVMSYLRLFALGLASASLAGAFNDMADGVRAAVPGVGFLFALVVLALGHTLNLTLAVASGFIHGLRLNVIEFLKHGVKEEGTPLPRLPQEGDELMDPYVLALGWIGIFAPLAAGAIGSMIGVARGGMAACGAMLEVDSGYGRFVGVAAMPSSQTIYGIVVTLSLHVAITEENAGGIFAIGVLSGLALLASAIYQGASCAAAINVSKSKPEVFGISVAPAAVVEGFAVFAFVFALVLAGDLTGGS